MNRENAPHEEIRGLLEAARVRVRAFTGLHPDEDLAQEVLHACDEAAVRAGTSPRLEELRRLVEAQCRRLAAVTDRFSGRDPAAIAAARGQTLAVLDQIQDAALELHAATPPGGPHGFLKRRSL